MEQSYKCYLARRGGIAVERAASDEPTYLPGAYRSPILAASVGGLFHSGAFPFGPTHYRHLSSARYAP